MKVGGWDDLETVRSVSEFSDAALWVDANEAFSPQEAPSAVRKLKETGVAMVEQPVPVCAGSEALKSVTEAAYPVPVVADESAVNAADVPRLAGRVSGVNVKLAKCGGIRGALRMIHTARAHGMLVMLGCMVETSLGIAAAAQLGNLADFVDLDGAMLLADDPFEGPATRTAVSSSRSGRASGWSRGDGGGRARAAVRDPGRRLVRQPPR
jgi:L-alanine-DL-glutamate epimerase-like enolase superfamily enzyme